MDLNDLKEEILSDSKKKHFLLIVIIDEYKDEKKDFVCKVRKLPLRSISKFLNSPLIY